MRIVEELVKEGRISTEAFRGTAAIGKKGEATSSGKHWNNKKEEFFKMIDRDGDGSLSL